MNCTSSTPMGYLGLPMWPCIMPQKQPASHHITSHNNVVKRQIYNWRLADIFVCCTEYAAPHSGPFCFQVGGTPCCDKHLSGAHSRRRKAQLMVVPDPLDPAEQRMGPRLGWRAGSLTLYGFNEGAAAKRAQHRVASQTIIYHHPAIISRTESNKPRRAR